MLSLIKEAVKQTVEAEKMADVTVGVVVLGNPLRIQIEQKLILGKGQLVVAERLTDRFEYATEVEYGFEDIKDKSKYEARRKFAVYGGLRVGDKVILVRKAGGQKYYVIDRVGG